MEEGSEVGYGRACFLARVAVDLAHFGAGYVVGEETPVDAVVAVHAARRKIEVIGSACVLG